MPKECKKYYENYLTDRNFFIALATFCYIKKQNLDNFITGPQEPEIPALP